MLSGDNQLTTKTIRPYLINYIELEGRIKQGADIIGWRNTETLNIEFNVECNYAWMQVWTTPQTNFNNITELLRGDYIHMKCRLRTEATKNTQAMENIILECDEIFFTGTLKEFVKYKGLTHETK